MCKGFLKQLIANLKLKCKNMKVADSIWRNEISKNWYLLFIEISKILHPDMAFELPP